MNHDIRFTPESIARLGITFPTWNKAAAFAAFLEEECEVRVGQALGQQLTDEECNEFLSIDDPQSSADWLNLHCPNYRSVVRAARRRLEDEVLRFRGRIAGACLIPYPVEDELFRDDPEDDLFV